MMFGYFDFGQASYLYNHQWFHDVDTALDELVDSQLNVARRMSAGEGFGAWFDEVESWTMNYGLLALGLPDAVGRGIEMSGDIQRRITDAILPQAVRDAFSDLKRWFIDMVMEEAFGFTLTELENYLRDPGAQTHQSGPLPPGDQGEDRPRDRRPRPDVSSFEVARTSFVAFQNTLNMIKLQIVEPAELARVLWTGGSFQPVDGGAPPGVRAGQLRQRHPHAFMGNLDAGYNWDRPDSRGWILWETAPGPGKDLPPDLQVDRPGAGLD